MTKKSRREEALFETTKRLLSHIVNEGLCFTSVEPILLNNPRWLCLSSQKPSKKANLISRIRVKLAPNTCAKLDHVASIRPDQLAPPVILEPGQQASLKSWAELDPGVIFENIFEWFGEDNEQSTRDLIKRELQNSAANQELWLEFGESQPELDILSPAIAWEKSLIWGHPTHPLHRTCYAQPPLKQIDLSEALSPNIIFLSVSRSQIRVSGPFESTLNALLFQLGIPEPASDRITIPTLAQQQPAIVSRFPDVYSVGSDRGFAQASMRTVSLRPELQFKYHLKLALACQITSALRTITPWTALGAPAVSDLLAELLPADLWVFREVASVTGAQTDFDDAKHLSCILREDLEFRARSQGESLIIASALSQPRVYSNKTHAESIFDLRNREQKIAWFRSYTACLLKLTLQPLLAHGIGLEAHGQNVVARVCIETKEIKGFAIRDFGGIRLYMPKLHDQGFRLDSIPPGSAITSYSIHDVWHKVHHSLFQNHIGQLLIALGLENGGWKIVRDELKKVLRPEEASDAAELYAYFLQDQMPFKCFLRMKMEGKYRDYVERRVPNVLLS